jgi:hypothetical protein
MLMTVMKLSLMETDTYNDQTALAAKTRLLSNSARFQLFSADK